MRRSRTRVQEIDGYIYREYPAHGADYVAEQLGEPVEYIRNRAWYLRVGTQKRIKKKKVVEDPAEQEIVRLRADRDQWRQKYQDEVGHQWKRKYQVEVLRRKRLEDKLLRLGIY